MTPEISYVEYRNPYSALDEELLEMVLDFHPHLTYDHKPPMPLPEFILARADWHEDWPEEIGEWLHTATAWIPEDVFEWWQSQFPQNENLDNMSREWWLTQMYCFVAARDKATGMVVGGVAMCDVDWQSRSRSGGHGLIFSEMRGLVVEPRYRRTSDHIGTQLVRRIVDISDTSIRSKSRPLVAMTTNPVAGHMFESAGATLDPTNKGLSLTQLALVQLACWRRLGACGTQPFCDSCPQTDAMQVWIWPPKDYR